MRATMRSAAFTAKMNFSWPWKNFEWRVASTPSPMALTVVEKGEDAIRALGFRQFRVRHHGEMVRIEIARDELPRALNPAMTDEFTRVFKALGFKFVTLA